MPGLIGRKVGMTSLFDVNGKNVPCTVIEAGPCVVTQIKTKETDGYEAVQIAFGEKKEKSTSKAELGHFKKVGTTPKAKVIELSQEDLSGYKLGDVLTVEALPVDTLVDVIGISKGKGFQGVVKRYGFGGVGGTTHGQSDRLRAPGSMGASSWPSRVFKGKRLAGRMGGDRVKLVNLQVMKVIAEGNLVLVKGAVPGANGSFLTIEY